MMRKGTDRPNLTCRYRRKRVRAIFPVLVAVAVGSTASGGCNDAFEPVWASSPNVVDLFSLARPELNLPSAFSFYQRLTYRVEGTDATGAWDLALDTRDGELVFLPPRVLGIESRAGIAPLDDDVFEEVDRAPSDTAAYIKSEPVRAELGRVYVVQTGVTPGTFGRSCVRYAKMEPVQMDAEAGFLAFLYDANPICNDRRLIPPS
jgi:hypothetical protein